MSSLDVRVVSLWGMGGIGKTTLAEAVYKQIKDQFGGACFFRNVREESKKQGLCSIQQTLFSELLMERSANIRDPLVKVRLCRTKVLIVLDDVDDVDQLKCLALDQLESLARYRNWFGQGSRIIVTSRDKNVLDNIGDHETYEVEKLGSSEALQLFRSKAFQENSSTEDHAELSRRVVNYADGIPLALTVLGCHLLNKNTKEWESELDLLRKSPNDKVYNALKISFDGLNENARNVFLDVAHFFKGEDPDFVEGILKANGLFAAAAIRVLIDRSLLTIMDNKFWMHDLVQQMGLKIVHEESKEPGERSRLCSTEDVYCVLRGNTGTGNIQGIQMNVSELEEDEDRCLDPLVFKKMPNLRLLKVIQRSGCTKTLNFSQGLESLPDELRYLSWDYYPLESLPSDFKMRNLVELHLRNSQLEHLCLGVQRFQRLKVLNLERSRNLTQIPDLTKAPSLEKIKLQDCERVVNLPRITGMKFLQSLDLSGCSRVDQFPELPRNIKELNMSGTKIRQVPSTIEHLSHLEIFDLRKCYKLETLPTSIHKLKSLQSLDLYGCSRVDQFPELPRNIKELNMSGTKIRQVPSTIEHLSHLENLVLSQCHKLETLPTSIHKLKSLELLSLTNCIKLKYLPKILEPHYLSTDLPPLMHLHLKGTRISEIPDWIVGLPSLSLLDISGTSIRTIPASIKYSKLELFYITDCKFLLSLPELPASTFYVDAEGCTSLEKLTISSIANAPQVPSCISNYERLVIDDSLKLDRDDIMNEFLSRAVRMANGLAKGIPDRGPHDDHPHVLISILGKEIPEWFSHKEEGCVISTKLSPDWYNTNFTGFAACLILGWDNNGYGTRIPQALLRCEMYVKTINGPTRINLASDDSTLRRDRTSNYVFLWYFHVKDLDSSAEEISFHFNTDTCYFDESAYEVKRCGIRMREFGTEDKVIDRISKQLREVRFLIGRRKNKSMVKIGMIRIFYET